MTTTTATVSFYVAGSATPVSYVLPAAQASSILNTYQNYLIELVSNPGIYGPMLSVTNGCTVNMALCSMITVA